MTLAFGEDMYPDGLAVGVALAPTSVGLDAFARLWHAGSPDKIDSCSVHFYDREAPKR